MTGQDIVKRYDSMNDYAIGNWQNLWQECADWCWPTNDNINRIRIEGQEKSPQRMIDTCIEANFNFASGFFSHMFPPNTMWASFRHPNPKIMDDPEVAYYFEAVSRYIHQVLISSNFAQEEFESLLSMGCFGTNALVVEEDDKEIVRFRNFTINKIRIQENYLGKVDVVAREFELTPRQSIQQFGKEMLLKADLECIINDEANSKDVKYTFINYVAPREDFDATKKDATNKPFASYYASRKTGKIVKEGGFDYCPYKVSRFSTGNDEIYGRGPMSMVLGTTRRTNAIYRSMLVSAEQHANPQWLTPDDDSVSGISARAGAMIKWRATNPNGKPERLPPNGDPGIAVDMYNLHEQQIKRMFFNHLFRPLEDYRNMSATEVNERMTSDLMTISSFVSRYKDEHITPVMNHVYYICQKKGLLPPPPASISEFPNYEIDYVGRLSLATKSFEALGAINTMRTMSEIGAHVPQMASWADNIDVDDVTRKLWFSNSADMSSLKDPERVKEERAARTQMAQNQKMVENIPAMADAAQKLSGGIDPTSIIAQAGE